ncbi:hypothetical protein [Actinacidiphila oryziradicis]|uniref:hypothetical protein n=1 Tax=Actinacidiphila oryziradicis TaxID=2571141 RepID=UPI0023EF6401|nr:hypothetical protein [Actinacidiphila oryziradicis]MCW2875536.1 monooxygenase, FAD-binding [Actinacidiphila oryziradicis]
MSRTVPAAGRKAGGFTPGALVPLPLRAELDDLRYTLLVSGPERPEVPTLLDRGRAELRDVVDVRVLHRRGGGVLALARPDGHVDRVSSQKVEPINARLTDLFRPLPR